MVVMGIFPCSCCLSVGKLLLTSPWQKAAVHSGFPFLTAEGLLHALASVPATSRAACSWWREWHLPASSPTASYQLPMVGHVGHKVLVPRTAWPGDTGTNHGGMSQDIMALCGLSGRGRWGGDVLPVCAITQAELCVKGCHPPPMPHLMQWGGHMQCLQSGTTLGSEQSSQGNLSLNSDVEHAADTHPWSRPSPEHRCVSHLTIPGACRTQLEAHSPRHLLLCS